MATQEEVRQLIGGLPSEEAQALFAEFNKELQKFSTWAAKTTAFREEIGEPDPGDPSFGDAVRAWETSRARAILDRMVDRVMSALVKRYGVVAVGKEDVLDFLKDMRTHK